MFHSQEYDPIHPPDAITSNLPLEKQYVCLQTSFLFLKSSSLGPVQPDTVEKVVVQITDEEKARLERMEQRPSLDEILNLHDFEVRKI